MANWWVLAVALFMVGLPAVLVADATPEAGAVVYEDVAAAVGLDFQLAGEVYGDVGIQDPWPSYPEIMGAGACWLDFDQDGYEDLYIVNQRFNRENPHVGAWADDLDPRNALYRNVGDGTFEDVSAASGADSDQFGLSCSAADFDDDGDLDLFVGNFGDNQLLRNDGGTFTDVSEASGINSAGSCGVEACLSAASAWGDFDQDGDLDLYVANYVDTTFTDTQRMPENHAGQLNFLLRNDGGTFTDVAQALGVAGLPEDSRQGSKSLGVIWFDADLDGDLDLYVTNDVSHNKFYVNHGGTFEDASMSGRIADDGASMGVASGDYDQDGYPDLFFTHYAHEEHGFYRNNGDLSFQGRSGEDGLLNEEDYVGWGAAFVDLERDGDLDLVATHGHTEPFLDDYAQATKFYYNEPGDGSVGDRLWVDRSADSGPGATALAVTRGTALADYDLDGDTDMVLVNNGNGTVQFLRAGGHDNNWLSLLLRQPAPNVHAVGSRVVVEAAGQIQTLELQAGSSYSSQNSQRLDFGLGAAPVADSITVYWPDGGVSEYLDVAANQVLRLDRVLGIGTDTLSPVTTLVLNGIRDGTPWWTTPVEVVLDAVDRNVGAPAGLDRVEYRIDGGDWQTYATPLQFDQTGTYLLECRSVDLAGNWEPMRATELVIDVTPPAASHELRGDRGLADWWVSAVDVTLSAEDDLSGVGVLRYRIDGGPWQTYQAPFGVGEAGRHVVEYQAIDRADNPGEIRAVELLIDIQAPFGRIDDPRQGRLYVGDQVLPGPIENRAVLLRAGGPLDDGVYTVHAVASDDQSGVARVVFWLDGRVQFEDSQAPYAWDWNVLEAGAGDHRVRIDVHDVAGHVRSHGLGVVTGWV